MPAPFRTRFTADVFNNVTLHYECRSSGTFRIREFHAPAWGGEVREWPMNGNESGPVFAGLCGSGWILEWNPEKGPLVALIRREYRKLRRAERRAGFR